jgi:hypothetical protein
MSLCKLTFEEGNIPYTVKLRKELWVRRRLGKADGEPIFNLLKPSGNFTYDQV